MIVLLPTLFALLACLAQNVGGQEALIQNLAPKIDFINIQAGSPTITLTFQAPTLELDSALTDFWVKIEVPFSTPSLGPPTWSSTTTCCDYSTMPFYKTTETLQGYSGNYSIIYVKLIGSVWDKTKTYVLQLQPTTWMNYVGYTEFMKLSIVSSNSSTAITYAYNFAYMNFYASDVASNNLIVQDATTDSNMLKVNQVIDSYLIVQMGYSTAQRIILQTKGSYKFAPTANITCALVADASLGITVPDPGTVTCGFWENLGPNKRNSLVFTWSNDYIPAGKYKLKYQLSTPATSGEHHLTILTMARYYPYIYLKKDYQYIFSAVNDGWETGFPRLYYSSGYNANNALLADQVGMYSMGLGYHRTFNSLRFVVRASTVFQALNPGEKFSLDVYVGNSTALLPLGYVYENLPLASGYTVKNITFINGTLTIHNIDFVKDQAYTVSFKVAFRTEQALPTDNVRGFGVCVLRKGNTTVFKGRAAMRSRFNVVQYNPSFMTVESVDRTDNYKRRHRGFSGVRSAPASELSSVADYTINTGKNGLRVGSNQNIWIQSSVGPNPISYLKTLSSTHQGSRMFLDIVTDKSIELSAPTSTCDVYNRVYGTWVSAASKANSQAVLNKYGGAVMTISTFTSGTTANFIGGCFVTPKTVGGDSYTLMRMRFNDVEFTDSNNVKSFVRAKDMVMVDSNEVQTTNGALGNYFVWKSMKVNKFHSMKMTRSDAVVLDAFMLWYLYSGTTTTSDDMQYPPDIYAMDNMYVIASDEDVFPISISIFATVQHNWMYDSDTNPLKWALTINPADKWPVVLNFFGQLKNLPATTKYMVIFFDFFDLLVNDNSTQEVGCSVHGVTVQSCKYGRGYNSLDEQVYRTIANNAGYLYATSRLSNYLLLEILSTDAVNFAKDFSIALPVRPFNGTNIDKLATLYENSIVVNPGFIALDENWDTLNFVEFGLNAKSMKIDTKAYSQSYVISTKIEALELFTSDVRTLDDTTPNNNIDNSFWIDALPAGDLTIGSIADVKLKSVCTTCSPYSFPTNIELFSTGLICGNWPMGKDPSFVISYLPSNDQMRPHYIKYLNNDGVKRTCIYLPSLKKSTTTADAQVQTYDMFKFFVPNYSGTKWPADMVSVVSNGVVLKYFKPQSLNRVFLTNQIKFDTSTETMSLVQGYNSAKVTLNFQISNPLPKGGVFFFGITAGCEGLLTIYGDDGTPPCYIRNNLVIGDGSGALMECIYSINAGGFQIELQQALPLNSDVLTDNNIEVTIYGLSIKKATQSNTCSFVMRSYLSLSKNPLQVIDKSSNSMGVTYNLPINASYPSGSMMITSFSSDNNQVTAYSNVIYNITVADRNIYKTDYISLSLGALKYDTDDRPVWCSVLSPTTGKYLPDFTTCVIDNLGLIGLKAYKDLSYNSVSVKISNVINPISKTPGAISEYYINEGFINFESNSQNWNNIVNYESFLNPVRAWVEFDVIGIKSDIFISFIPDYPVNTTNVIYLYFSPHYIPILSKYNIFVSLKYKSPSAKAEVAWINMKIWNIAPRMLAITGWPSTIPANSNITMRILGIDNPVTPNDRVFQVILGFEKQYSVFKQWGYTSLQAGAPLSPIKLINIEKFSYDSLIIRENTKITLQFRVSIPIPPGSYLMVILNYLGDETVRQFKPYCYLTKASEFVDSAERCYCVGNRLEARTSVLLGSDTLYTFIMDDIPNPDYGYKEPEPIVVMIVSKDRQTVLSISTEMVINYKREEFVKRDIAQILDYQGIVGGVLEVPQGFYSTVDIGPTVVDSTKESPFFLDTTTFALGDVDNNNLVSKPLDILGITSFVGQIGSSTATLIIGASKTTVLTTYAVQITKKEASGKIYTELPLLRVKVVPVTYSLDGLSSIDVYIGSRSIPIKLSIDKVPTDPIKFDILFLAGDINGKLQISNKQQQFSLSETQLAFFLQIEAYDTTITPQNVIVTVRSVLSSSNFADKVINLNLIPLPATMPTLGVSFTTPTVSTELYEYTFQVKSNQQVFVYYYVQPNYLFSDQTKDTVRAWALNGLSVITNDIVVGSLGIVNLNVNIDAHLTSLIADTTYTMVVYYESVTSSDVAKKTFTFSTKALTSKNGNMTLTFGAPALYESRIKVLCIIAKKYSLTLENLWSGDSLNCDTTSVAEYVLNYHKNNEKEPMGDDVKTQISTMDVLAFQSKRKGQNSAGLANLYASSSLPGAVNVFSLYLNGVVRLTALTAMGDFTETKPTLTKSTSTQPGSTTAKITGITFSGVKGFIYAVAQRAEEMSDTLTTLEIRQVSKFNSYYWAPVNTSPSEITIELTGLKPSSDYKAAIVATSNDPRAGAASSEVIYVTFRTTDGSWSRPLYSAVFLTLLTSILLVLN